jgi:hypothetical protein
MKILLDKSPDVIRRKRRELDFDFWQLRTPLTRYKIEGVKPYGLDNGCFSGQLPKCWDRLIEEARDVRPLFVAVPDIVGSARRTLDLFEMLSPSLQPLPLALVLQDDIGNHAIPWDRVSAVFVGGSDAFKIAPEAFHAARTAKMLGKWVHVGRVNEHRRVENWIGLADSIDGSGISQYDHMLREVVETIKGNHKQQKLQIGA